jgi:virulence factor Mce-like protein
MARDRLEAGPRRLLGLGMIALVVAILGVCALAYARVFTPKVPVTMIIDQANNSFWPDADVRLRGINVGRVATATSTGRFAVLNLELQPDAVSFIPRNVVARILPKSLFGERYVALMEPANPTPQRIQAGDVITPDRSADAIEIDAVFNNLLPLLQAVRPADLATTLGAVNQALTNRGAELGDTITRLHDYLSKFNPSLPDLTADIRALPKVTDTYSTAAPNLIEALKNLNTTSRTLVQKRGDFAELYRQLTETSYDLKDFFDDTGDDIIRLVRNIRPIANLLEVYAPQSVCLFGRLADAIPEADRVFSKYRKQNVLHITAELVVNRGKFVPHQDEPDITEERGARCYSNKVPLPQYPGGPPRDGSTHPPASPQTSRVSTFDSVFPDGDNRHLEGRHDVRRERDTFGLQDPRPHGRGNSPRDKDNWTPDNPVTNPRPPSANGSSGGSSSMLTGATPGGNR